MNTYSHKDMEVANEEVGYSKKRKQTDQRTQSKIKRVRDRLFL